MIGLVISAAGMVSGLVIWAIYGLPLFVDKNILLATGCFIIFVASFVAFFTIAGRIVRQKKQKEGK